MSAKGERYTVKFTEKELDIVMEALGAYKTKLKAKATKMRRLHGVQPGGRHTMRSERARTAQFKLSDSKKEGQSNLND